jgi:uncharacterized zinc-type alcohol dehydrogenase-like protein
MTVLALPNLKKKLEIPFFELLINGLRIEGRLSGSKADLRELLDFTLKHKVYPDVQEVPFREFDHALERLQTQCPPCKIVVNTHDWQK